MVGRQPGPEGIEIAEASVSRRHARLSFAKGGGWSVVDLESSNGTSHNGRPLTSITSLVTGDMLAFGQTAFYFAERVSQRERTTPERPTYRPLPHLFDEDAEDGEITLADLRSARFMLTSPSGGGGGLLEIGGVTIHLSVVQFALVQVLAKRMSEEPHHDPRVRGFVRSSELSASLPWDATRPDENHLKQLVRRLRRALARAGVADVIESRHGFGYRLRVVPDAGPR